MIDRQFTEVDLRRMLEQTSRFDPDAIEGRWVITTFHAQRRWEVIVEPEPERLILVIITAFPAD
jgi:hypothetical protein